MKDACDIYVVAQQWRLPFLAKKSLQYCLSNLNPDNVTQFYEMGQRNSENLVRASCLKIFKTKTNQVLKNPNFCKAKLSTVLRIFSLDHLNIDSELDLFEAAVRYADATDQSAADRTSALNPEQRQEEQDLSTTEGPSPAKRQRIDDSIDTAHPHDLTFKKSESMLLAEENNSIQNSTQNLTESPCRNDDSNIIQNKQNENMDVETLKKSTLRIDKEKLKYRCLLHQIRFLTLTPQEFAECTTLSSLLTESEILALTMNIASKETSWPMPEGFSKSLLPRQLAMKEEFSRLKGSFHSTINNFNRSFKKYESIPFYVRNLAWTLMMLHSSDTPYWVVIAVTCFYDEEPPSWIPFVSCKFKLSTREHVPDNLRKKTFESGESSSEYYTWIAKMRWSDLINPVNGFIKNNSLTYNVDVNTCKRLDKIKVKDSANETLNANNMTTTPMSTAVVSSSVTTQNTDNPVTTETRPEMPNLDNKTTTTPTVTSGPLMATSVTSTSANPCSNTESSVLTSVVPKSSAETSNLSKNFNTTLTTATALRVSTTVTTSGTPSFYQSINSLSETTSNSLTTCMVEIPVSKINTFTPLTPKPAHTSTVRSLTNIPLSSTLIAQKSDLQVTPANHTLTASPMSMDEINTPEHCDLSCEKTVSNTSAILSETQNLKELFSTPVIKEAQLLDDTLPSYDIKRIMSPPICNTPLSRNSYTLDSSLEKTPGNDSLPFPNQTMETTHSNGVIAANTSQDNKNPESNLSSSFVKNKDCPSTTAECENETHQTSSMDI